MLELRALRLTGAPGAIIGRCCPVAHAGHWALWILYAVPVIVVVASIVTSMRRERREAADGEPTPDDTPS